MRTPATHALVTALLGATLAAALPSAASADVHNYIRWRSDGQLDYRLLLQRYMPVSSFRYGREYYGYPYAASGGLLAPQYYFAPGYYPAPYGYDYGYEWGSAPLHHY